jgi:hypothetical protein
MGPHDIALLRLSEPVKGVTPIDFFSKDNEVELIATIIGHGDTRKGTGGQWISDDQLRGATSKIDRADKNWIYLTFDEPPKGTELEGAPGRGDSGGPAIIFIDGKNFVAGVSSLGMDGKNGPGTYGAEDSFVRVSAYNDWIKIILAGKQKGTPFSSKTSETSNSKTSANSSDKNAKLPDNAAGKVVNAFIKAFNSGKAENMRGFYAANLSEEAAKRRPIEARLEVYQQMFANLGGIELKQVLNAADSISILIKREKGEWQRFDFEFSPPSPDKLSGFANQTAEPPTQ